jgi:hypothetical protein
MCNLCENEEPDEIIELKGAAAEGASCDCPSESDEAALCGELARYCSISSYVDSHLCEEHMRELKADLEAGLIGLAQEAGLILGAAIKPIMVEGSCDEFVSIDGVESDCLNTARYAYVVRSPNYLCEAHKQA